MSSEENRKIRESQRYDGALEENESNWDFKDDAYRREYRKRFEDDYDENKGTTYCRRRYKSSYSPTTGYASTGEEYEKMYY